MHQELFQLLKMGFSPTTAIMLFAFSVGLPILWLRIVRGEAKNEEIRRKWHGQTAGRVAIVEKQAQECYRDREALRGETTDLKVKVASMEVRLDAFDRCGVVNCPVRKFKP